MSTEKQRPAARRNIKKAQARAQPEGLSRKRPGTLGKGRFYRIEVRPKQEFLTFRIHDVGEEGGLERLAGRRSSGSWDTVTWLVEKKSAHLGSGSALVIDDPKVKAALDRQVRGPVRHIKGDVFRALPRKNVPESEKPTKAQRTARTRNIGKARAARRKRD